ncbi:MAG: DUF2948 family protein [Microvirga sp.]|jgi:hypothetical protein|nr:DUF2948 family protein [Beijerinckiaceae bacterium]HZY22276.1 DUF2948 family protein [Beijerinckiaceae bacterium]
MELLRLVALDEEDLAVISTHLQDAVVRVGDLALLAKEHRFALCARRFDWECGLNEPPRRRLTGLHFERVTGCRCRGIDRSKPDTVLNLLGIAFEEKDPPSGSATLLFSDGAAIQLDLECIETQMKDLGPVWEAEGRRPAHDLQGA